MAYLQYRFLFKNSEEEKNDILIARMSSSGFEGFWQNGDELYAYAEEKALESGAFELILKDPVFETLGISYQVELLAERNWNEEWEKSYPPVVIDDICTIVAPFHSQPEIGLSIVIEPKMSFGTGHHQTTRMMIRQIHSLDIRNYNVLDIGCGTGVLGIYALIQGAGFVTAIDIDEWACLNSQENFLRNGFQEKTFEIIQGDASSIPQTSFDLILANINRNILMADMPVYTSRLKHGGRLIISGILESDREAIIETALKESLHCIQSISEDRWISLSFFFSK